MGRPEGLAELKAAAVSVEAEFAMGPGKMNHFPNLPLLIVFRSCSYISASTLPCVSRSFLPTILRLAFSSHNSSSPTVPCAPGMPGLSYSLFAFPVLVSVLVFSHSSHQLPQFLPPPQEFFHSKFLFYQFFPQVSCHSHRFQYYNFHPPHLQSDIFC